MNDQNTARMYVTFPSLFMERMEGEALDARLANEYGNKFAKQPDREGRYPCLPYGFECGDGWYKLLFQLCENITHVVRIHDLKPCMGQVKEKFGLLRFYLRFPDDVVVVEPGDDCVRGAVVERKAGVELIYRLIHEAERQSGITCMRCGKAGVMRTNGWHHVSCDACEALQETEFG